MVFTHQGLASGEALVRVVGDAEIALARQHLVWAVVLVVLSQTWAIDRDDGLGVGGEDLGDCEVVDFGEEGNISTQELADGQWRTVNRSGSERELGLATGFDAVAFKPIRDVLVFDEAVGRVVTHVRLLGFWWMLLQQHDQQQNGANVI